jgi:hypothetical protein
MDGIVCDKHGVQRQRPCPVCESEKKDAQIWELQAKVKELEATIERGLSKDSTKEVTK